jgi:hypothetical protein
LGSVLKNKAMKNSKSERKVYHVSPDAAAERWVVSQENAEFRREFDRKEEAVDFAKERAQEAELGQVKVHRKDGNMEYESTYGEDPTNSPG